MNSLEFFLLVLRASLLSTSGTGNLPALRSDLVAARGWTTDHQIAEALAIGQVSPGPSGLWVVSLGYLTDGMRGALLAVVAICLPPLLVIPLGRIYARTKHHPAVEGFVRGLGTAVVGVFAVVMLNLLGKVGVNVRTVLIALIALGLGASRRVPILVILALAAAFGILVR